MVQKVHTAPHFVKSYFMWHAVPLPLVIGQHQNCL